VMARVPPEIRQRIVVLQQGGGADGGPEELGGTTGTFDVEQLKAKVHREFEDRRRTLQTALAGAPPGDPRRAALDGMEAGERKAMQMVDDLALAMKEAFTDAIRTVYQASILIALLGLLIALIAPEVPLRGPSGGPRPVAE